jgi:hypothetical protein
MSRVQESANSFQDISLVAVLVPSDTETKPTLLSNEMACRDRVHPSSGYARVVGHRHITMDSAIEIVQSLWSSRTMCYPDCIASVRLFDRTV